MNGRYSLLNNGNSQISRVEFIRFWVFPSTLPAVPPSAVVKHVKSTCTKTPIHTLPLKWSFCLLLGVPSTLLLLWTLQKIVRLIYCHDDLCWLAGGSTAHPLYLLTPACLVSAHAWCDIMCCMNFIFLGMKVLFTCGFVWFCGKNYII